MSDILQSTIEVEARGHKYVFRIPGIQFDIEVGYRALQVRQRAAPEGTGALDGLDYNAALFSRYCAIMELYLERSDAGWTHSPGVGGKPVVDSLLFPVSKTMTVYEIGRGFELAFARFRDDRPADGDEAGAEAVAGGQG